MVVPNNRAKRRNIQPSKDRLTAFGPFIAMMGEDMLSTQTLRRLREAGVYDKENKLTPDWHEKSAVLYKTR